MSVRRVSNSGNEKRDRRQEIMDLLNSDEGKKVIDDVIENARKVAESLRKAREIDVAGLRTPMTF